MQQGAVVHCVLGLLAVHDEAMQDIAIFSSIHQLRIYESLRYPTQVFTHLIHMKVLLFLSVDQIMRNVCSALATCAAGSCRGRSFLWTLQSWGPTASRGIVTACWRWVWRVLGLPAALQSGLQSLTVQDWYSSAR